jgi:MinD-like ATPase involved in chromosome partitioning or flagellar assembly
MAKVHMILQGKGGVGKSFIASIHGTTLLRQEEKIRSLH